MSILGGYSLGLALALALGFVGVAFVLAFPPKIAIRSLTEGMIPDRSSSSAPVASDHSSGSTVAIGASELVPATGSNGPCFFFSRSDPADIEWVSDEGRSTPFPTC
jgi:hypothetical protein